MKSKYLLLTALLVAVLSLLFLKRCDLGLEIGGCQRSILEAGALNSATPSDSLNDQTDSADDTKKAGSLNQVTGVKTEGRARVGEPREINIEGRPRVSSPAGASRVAAGLAKRLGYGPDVSLDVVELQSDDYGNTYVQLSRKYKGVPILMSDARLEVVQGRAERYSGQIDPFNIEDLDVEPTYSAEAAFQLFCSAIGTTVIESQLQDSNLAIFLLPQTAALVWHLDATLNSTEQSGSYTIVVDAHSGETLGLQALRTH